MARILAVDDDEKIRALLDTLLSRKGHYVFTADHGQKGIEVFQRERPDITILDIEMPDMNGIAVLRQIRSVDPGASVIILTGSGTGALEQQARELGAAHFLPKGFSLHELGAAINQVMQERDLAIPSVSPSKHTAKGR